MKWIMLGIGYVFLVLPYFGNPTPLEHMTELILSAIWVVGGLLKN